MANTSSEGFVSTASRRAAASGRAFRAYQTKDVDQLYRELLHKRYQKYAFSYHIRQIFQGFWYLVFIILDSSQLVNFVL